MHTTILQVPISKKLRDSAALEADHQGFSSLQEAVRVFLSQLSRKSISIKFEPQTVRLSPKNITRYNKIIDEVDSGKVKMKSFSDPQKLIAYLTGNK